jgi:photosystem II stability/assembly factor-like uncharacterized protein
VYGDIWTSTTSGASWTDQSKQSDNLATSGLGWQSIASSSDGTHLAAVVVYRGDIWTSANSGASWTDQSKQSGNFATSGLAQVRHSTGDFGVFEGREFS